MNAGTQNKSVLAADVHGWPRIPANAIGRKDAQKAQGDFSLTFATLVFFCGKSFSLSHRSCFIRVNQCQSVAMSF
jgi:hypothetical protein